jgi:hypothetical protein
VQLWRVTEPGVAVAISRLPSSDEIVLGEYDGEKVESAKGPAGIGSCTTVSSVGVAASSAAANVIGAAVGCRAATSAAAR